MSTNALSAMCMMAVVTVFASGPAMSEPATESKGSVAEQIRTINEQITVLSAQFSEAEMRAKIAAKNEEIRRIGQGQSASQAPGQMPPSAQGSPIRPQMQIQEDLPSIQSIDGVDGKLNATLLMRNGGVQTVRLGDKVGPWTVKTISISAVKLAKGKETVVLNFGSIPAAQSNVGMSTNAPYPNAGGNFASTVPPLPMMPSP